MKAKIFFCVTLAVIPFAIGPRKHPHSDVANKRSLLAVVTNRLRQFAHNVVARIRCNRDTFLRLMAICKKKYWITLEPVHRQACDYLEEHECPLGLEITTQCAGMKTIQEISNWIDATEADARHRHTLLIEDTAEYGGNPNDIAFRDYIYLCVPKGLPIDQKELETGEHNVEYGSLEMMVYVERAMSQSERALLQWIAEQHEAKITQKKELERAIGVQPNENLLETAFNNLGINPAKPYMRNVVLGQRYRELGQSSRHI